MQYSQWLHACNVFSVLQVINKSLCSVNYQWDCCEMGGLSVSVQPANGCLGKISIKIFIKSLIYGHFLLECHNYCLSVLLCHPTVQI